MVDDLQRIPRKCITFLSPRPHAIDVPRRHLEIPLVAPFCFTIAAEVDGREVGVGFVELGSLGGWTTVAGSNCIGGRSLLLALGRHGRCRTAREQMPQFYSVTKYFATESLQTAALDEKSENDENREKPEVARLATGKVANRNADIVVSREEYKVSH